MAPAGEGGKKSDATGPIVVIVGVLLLLLLFGGQGCNGISLPTTGNYNNSGGYDRSQNQCDSRRYDCRGHYDGGGHWVPDRSVERDDHHHGSGHERTRPRPTDDPDPPGER